MCRERVLKISDEPRDCAGLHFIQTRMLSGKLLRPSWVQSALRKEKKNLAIKKGPEQKKSHILSCIHRTTPVNSAIRNGVY